MELDFRRLPEFDGHELVLTETDEKSGLKAFIAIHNTNLGPATGGTRYWLYDSEEEALRDALRLSRAMSYKCALAGVPYGGGKGVILAHPQKPKTKELIRAYARCIDKLQGRLYTGEDVGIDPDDVRVMLEITPFIIGKPGVAGDPSPWAALGVFYAIRAALKSVFGSEDISGRSFAVKGLGKCGLELARLLSEQGGEILGADINQEKIKKAKELLPKIKIVSPEEIHRQKVDLFAPCALSGDLNQKTISELRCKIVCGSANNQLSTIEDGSRLHEASILYIPDYLANAGGLVNVVAELAPGGYNKSWVEMKTEGIEATAQKIIDLSKKEMRPTSEISDGLAHEIFLKQAKINV